ncbi:MAG: energy transducer TonB [Sterolibacteriaceae bacterium MAG5]|nr:energy transducer TonB [Candidatus Nitricoxidireducens bremensis]
MQRNFAWPGPLADMDPPRRNLTLALGASLFIHAILLSIHFKLPEAINKATEHALDVILVNSKSLRKPTEAQARAQANLDGGGNTEENRRAKTPLPAAKNQREGNDLLEARRRVAELEAKQQQMMTQMQSEKLVAADPRRTDPAPPAPQPAVSGLDLASKALAAVRLEGEIARNLEEYNQRPKKHFFRPRASEYRFAQYVEDWRQKVERFGNLNYPESARGRLYGSLVLTAEINADGSLRSLVIDRPSPHKVLNEAARRIVEMASPYAAFPPDIQRDTDVISITRTWSFTSADRVQTD